MKIQEQDHYHGAALTQIVEASAFTALNSDPEKYGLYVINHDRRVLIKHAAKTRADGKYQFTFNSSDLQTLQQQGGKHADKTFVALVCAHQVICGLSLAQLGSLVYLAGTGNQWVTVEAPAGRQLRTRGTLGDGPLVAISAFPAMVLK